MKRFLFAVAVCFLPVFALAQTKTIPQLPAASALAGADLFDMSQGGVESKGTGTQVAAFLASQLGGDCTAASISSIVCAKINGNSVPSGVANNQLMIGTAASTFSFTTVPNCTDAGGNHLNFTAATNAVSCGTTGGGGQTTNPGYLVGNYYPLFPFQAITGTATAANEFRCLPYIPVTTATLDTIRIRSTTLAASGLAQIFIYASSASTKWPTSTPLAATGQFSTDTPAGFKDGSFTSGTGNSGSNFQVSAGVMYYLCQNFNNTTNVFIANSTTNGFVSWMIGSANSSFLATTSGMVLRYATSITFGTTNIDLTGVVPAEITTSTHAMMAPHIASIP